MTEQALRELLTQIRPVDPAHRDAAQARLDDLTKPPGSLGRLEEVALRLATIQGRVKPSVAKKRVYTLAGDHGVCAQGVSAYPAEVTPQMVMNFLAGGAAINVLTRHVGSEIVVVDMGVNFDFSEVEGLPMDGLVDRKVAPGTADFTKGPAMSREQALQALAAGVELAYKAAADRVELVGVGEMGIGNTTPAAALLAVFSGLSPEEVVGRGTGVDDEGLWRKSDAVARGIMVNGPDVGDPLGVLAALGGFEIAGMAGVYLGAAKNGLPVIADGFISTAAAIVAVKLCPAVSDYLFLSHLSQEQAHDKMIELLGIQPLVSLDMRLGEGTGAALAMTLMDGAAKILAEMATFSEAGVSNKE